jgi:ABC-type nitrate/sulfonate/bicarbonate transport system permease component
MNGPARRLGLSRDVWPRILAPLMMAVVLLGGWEFAVRHFGVPSYVMPGPLLIGETLVADWATLAAALAITLRVTVLALLAAVTTGVGLSVLFSPVVVLDTMGKKATIQAQMRRSSPSSPSCPTPPPG